MNISTCLALLDVLEKNRKGEEVMPSRSREISLDANGFTGSCKAGCVSSPT